MPKKGYKFSEESKEKMRQAKLKAGTIPPSQKGKTPWNFGNGRDKLVCPKCSGSKPNKKAKFCRGCTEFVPPNKGKFFPERRGENSPHWRGGLTRVYDKVRNSRRNKEWRKAVYERDGFQCLECGDNRGRNLNADHINPFSVILYKNKIETFDQAMVCEELWDISNGRTLCVRCHIKTETYGGKVRSLITLQV